MKISSLRWRVMVAVLATPFLCWAQPSFVCAGYEPPVANGAPRAKLVPTGLSSMGQARALVIFAAFAGEVPAGEKAPVWAERLFNAQWPGSLAHFYRTMSFAQFDLQGLVLPRRYISERTAAQFLNDNTSLHSPYGRFAREIVAQVDRDIDFGLYDNDGPDGEPNSGDDDGIVDYIFMNLRSVPRGFIRGGATGTAGLGLGEIYKTNDRRPNGKPILVHSGVPYGSLMQQGSFSQTVGVMAHEFGHALGLPDLYDVSYANPADDSAGIGRWGLMAWGAHGWNGGDGPAGFSAWSLERLGWIGRGNSRLIEVVEEGELRVEDLFAGGRIYKVHLPSQSRQTAFRNGRAYFQLDEGYLLLEQRSRRAHYYNRGLPGEGLLVWHVKPEIANNGDERAKAVDLVCADGLRDGGDDLDFWAHDGVYAAAHGGNQGDAGDIFDGVRDRQFDLGSNPSIHSVGDFASAALRPLSLRMRREGRAMRVQVRPPLWAGIIRQVELRQLMLSPEADPSASTLLQVKVLQGRTVIWSGSIELEAGGVLYRPDVELVMSAEVGLGTVISAEESVPVRAVVRTGRVVAADLVVYHRDSAKVVAELPMWRQGEAFSALFQRALLGKYDLALRLHSPDGATVFAAERLALNVRFEKWQPLLIVYNERVLTARRKAFDRALDQVLDERGIDANRVERGEAWGLGAGLLERYIGPGRAVVWLGRTISVQTSDVLARFLDQGGHLLATGLNFYRSPGSRLRERLPFARAAVPGISVLDGTSLSTLTSLPRIQHAALYELTAAAEPLLKNAFGDAAAVRVDNGLYRMVYYAFDLFSIAGAAQRDLLGDAVDFLRFAPLEGQLFIRGLENVEPLAGLDEIRPRLWVKNTGDGLGAAFSVGYEIHGSNGPLAARRMRVAALRPGESRLIELPSWTPPGEGRYRFEFSLRDASTGRRWDALEQTVDRLDLRGQFAAQTQVADTLGNGAAFFDYDADGDLDIYLVRIGRANRLYRNDRGALVEVAQTVGLANGGQGRAMALGDYDADGDLDLYLVNEQTRSTPGLNQLLRNEDGRFVDVTAALAPGAVLEDANSGRSAGFFDYDSDGDLDLYLVNAFGGQSSANRLFDNEGGQFSEMASAVGLADAHNGRGLAIGDYDNDGDPDVYVASHLGNARGAIYRNEVSTTGSFTALGAELGIDFAANEVGAVFGDYDNDGDLDLFVSNETGGNILWRNDQLGAGGRRETRFERVSADLGSRGIGAAFLDYDNDGDLDLVATAITRGYEGDQLYHNLGAGRLVEVGSLLGLREESFGRGLAIGDYDGDGLQDVLVADSRRTTLYRNGLQAAPWLEVELQGSAANRYALGARVELLVGGRRQLRELQSSYGYSSQVQPRLHFGLAGAAAVDSIKILWPDGRQSFAIGILANQRLLLAHPGAALKRTEPPQRISLDFAYPNPFNAETSIAFYLAAPGPVRLEIYNAVGQKVRTLVDETRLAGRHALVWDGRDAAGRSTSSGVYLYRLSAGRETLTRRLLLIK